MVDLAATLTQFNAALGNAYIKPSPCSAHRNLYVLFEDDIERITYARIIGNQAQALVAFLQVEPYEKKPCLNIGYAVAEPYRGKGIATEVIKESLEELRTFLSEVKIKDYYIEAVISVHNEASNRLAQKIISDQRRQIVCNQSGEDAYQYFRRFSEFE